MDIPCIFETILNNHLKEDEQEKQESGEEQEKAKHNGACAAYCFVKLHLMDRGVSGCSLKASLHSVVHPSNEVGQSTMRMLPGLVRKYVMNPHFTWPTISEAAD